MQEITQVKQRLGQGRAASRCKKPQTNQPITQSVKQPLKVSEDSNTQNKMPKYLIL